MMPLQQYHVKGTPEECTVIASFLYGSSLSIEVMHYSSSVNQPASSLRKPANDNNLLAPDGTSNSSSYILHARAQFAAHGTMIKCLQLS